MAQEFSEIEFSLFLTFFICLHNQLSSIHSIVTHLRIQIFKKGIHQTDSKNGRLLLLASFMTKLELIFVLTSENAFPYRFQFKASRKSIVSSTERY